MKHKRLSYVDEVRMTEVVEVKSIKGLGTFEEPISQITEYFTKDGIRLARVGINDKPEELHEWSNSLPSTHSE